MDAGGKLIPDLDIYRTGKILVKQHGEDAPIQAAMMPSLDIIELANQSKTGHRPDCQGFCGVRDFDEPQPDPGISRPDFEPLWFM